MTTSWTFGWSPRVVIVTGPLDLDWQGSVVRATQRVGFRNRTAAEAWWPDPVPPGGDWIDSSPVDSTLSDALYAEQRAHLTATLASAVPVLSQEDN